MAAPSSPSSSCEIVDLAVAATLGDATSQLFFSKGCGDLSWPEAAAIESTLTNKESLVALCDKYGVPRELEPVCAGKIAACHSPTEGQGSNALCIYADALEAGLRFPMPVFYGKLLRHYDLAFGVAPFPPVRRPSPPLLRQSAHQARLEIEVPLVSDPGGDAVEVPGGVGQAQEGERRHSGAQECGGKKAEEDATRRSQVLVEFQ
jgi:hypothetical protein